MREKKLEIKQVQELIRDGGLQNKIFTIDALHCNQQITQTIIDSKNDYLIMLKANKIKLFKHLKDLLKVEKLISIYQEIAQSHGRQISIIITVFEGKKIKHKNHLGIQSFIKIDRKGRKGNKESEETLSYISSKLLQSERLAEKIIGHWFI